MRRHASFEWDFVKEMENITKHGVSFHEARKAFNDPNRIILKDIDHSTRDETRYYCIGKVSDKVCTVRFTNRDNKTRIFGAGYWGKERKIYEQKNEK